MTAWPTIIRPSSVSKTLRHLRSSRLPPCSGRRGGKKGWATRKCRPFVFSILTAIWCASSGTAAQRRHWGTGPAIITPNSIRLTLRGASSGLWAAPSGRPLQCSWLGSAPKNSAHADFPRSSDDPDCRQICRRRHSAIGPSLRYVVARAQSRIAKSARQNQSQKQSSPPMLATARPLPSVLNPAAGIFGPNRRPVWLFGPL